MSAETQPIEEQRERIASTLEAKRDQLEELAASETAFAPRAEAALEWIDEHQEGDDA